MKQRITDFTTDDEDHWVALLECGHQQHVRHRPPFEERFWVLKKETRQQKIGIELNCKKCDETSEPSHYERRRQNRQTDPPLAIQVSS